MRRRVIRRVRPPGQVLLRFALRLRALFDGPSVLLLLLVNLTPVACVILLGWDIGDLMRCYWAENLVIGVFAVPKMIAAGVANGPAGIFGAVMAVPVFIVHFGLFWLGHGLFLLAMLSLGAPDGAVRIPSSVAEALASVSVVLWANIVAMVIFHAKELLFDWLPSGQARLTTPTDEMFAPYGRVGVLHLTLMGAMLVIMILGEPIWAVVLLGVGKTVLELTERRRRAEGARAREAAHAG